MRNIFLLYMPPGNLEAMVHYRDTIERRVSFARVSRFLTSSQAMALTQVFGERPVAIWGSRDTPSNRSKFDKMAIGDDLLIVDGDTIKLLGKVGSKMVNPDLSRELWHNILDPDEPAGWDLIYFIANPVPIGIPFAEFCRLFGYAENYQLRGFTTVSDAKLEQFYAHYDDLYSILVRVRDRMPVVERLPLAITAEQQIPLIDQERDDVEQLIASPSVSDHVKMQWKLATLGLKAGEKIWVPAADQGRLQQAYGFSQFEAEFATGIDLKKNYFENIDVVWKQEFRIDAAFEVENSTAIYSGLLRFADLNVVAPNTTYPMFVVAPEERRNRVREQLRRPVFQKLHLGDKVRFLPYERVDELYRFMADTNSGLTVDLIRQKADVLV